MLDFTDKTVAISGAAIGFGRAIATRFATAGAKVFGCDILDVDKANDGGIVMSKVDLLDRQAGASWIRTIEERTDAVSTSLYAMPEVLQANPNDRSKMFLTTIGTGLSISTSPQLLPFAGRWLPE
jgi:NADP-dependent 3-hydroxy acid dehydrogenase YdfG